MPTTVAETYVTLDRTAWIDPDRRLCGYPGRVTLEGGMDGLDRAEVTVSIARDGDEAYPVAARVVLESSAGVTQRTAAAWTGRLTRFAFRALTTDTIDKHGTPTLAPPNALRSGERIAEDRLRWLQSRSGWPGAEPATDERRVDYDAVLEAYRSGGYEAVDALDFCTGRNHAYVLVNRARRRTQESGG